MYYLIRIDEIESNNINFLKKINPDIYYAFYKWKLSLYHNRCHGESREIIEANEKNIDNLLAICHLKKYILFQAVDYLQEKIVLLKEPFSGIMIEYSLDSLYEASPEEVAEYIEKMEKSEMDALITSFTRFKLEKKSYKNDKKIISLQQYKMRKS